MVHCSLGWSSPHIQLCCSAVTYPHGSAASSCECSLIWTRLNHVSGVEQWCHFCGQMFSLGRPQLCWWRRYPALGAHCYVQLKAAAPQLCSELGIWMPCSFREMPPDQIPEFKLLTSRITAMLTSAALPSKALEAVGFGGGPASISHRGFPTQGLNVCEENIAYSPKAHSRMKWGSRCCRDWPVWDIHGSYCFLICGHSPWQTAWMPEKLESPTMGEHLLKFSLSSLLKLHCCQSYRCCGRQPQDWKGLLLLF